MHYADTNAKPLSVCVATTAKKQKKKDKNLLRKFLLIFIYFER